MTRTGRGAEKTWHGRPRPYFAAASRAYDFTGEAARATYADRRAPSLLEIQPRRVQLDRRRHVRHPPRLPPARPEARHRLRPHRRRHLRPGSPIARRDALAPRSRRVE